MRSTRPLTITLPHEMAQMVKDKVSSGEYASESEVIRDGLRTLAARDAAFESWLRDEIPGRLAGIERYAVPLIPMEDVFAALKTRHESRTNRDK